MDVGPAGAEPAQAPEPHSPTARGTTARGTAPRGRTARGGSVTLRLVRREARGDLPLLVCLALLVAVLTALCALGPALVGRQEDAALRQRVDAAQAQGPLLTVSTQPVDDSFDPDASTGPPMATVLSHGGEFATRLGGPLARTLSAVGGGSFDYNANAVDSPRPPDRTVAQTELTLSHISGAAGRTHYLDGVAPAEATPAGTLPQIALSQDSAAALGVRTGSRLSMTFTNPDGLSDARPQVAFTVSGVFRPTQPGAAFWDQQSTLAEPLEYPETTRAGNVLAVRGLVGAGTADLLTRAGVQGPVLTWQLHADLGRAAVARARELTGPLSTWSADLNTALCRGVDQSTGGPACQVGGLSTGPFLVSDGLSPLLAAFAAEDAQARTVGEFAVASLAAVALATAAVAVRLLLRRRETGLSLQRARGSSATRLVLLRSVVAWPVVLASAALGWAAGLALAPAGTSGTPQLVPAVAAALAVMLLLPLLTWSAVREGRGRGGSRPLAGARGGRTRGGASGSGAFGGGRRVVLELAVLLAAVAGVVTLRTQGADAELSAVPVLVALAAVLVLLRLYPLVLRLLARRFRRGTGLLAFVGLSRASRDASATGLALFVLVLTLGTAVFGGLVQRTVSDGAVAGAAWSTGGADATAVTTENVTPTLATSGVVATGGQTGGQVRIRAAVEQQYSLPVVGQADGAGISSVAVITLDPRQLAAMAPRSAGTPLMRALLSDLSTAPKTLADGTVQLPFVATPALRARERTGGFTASFQGYRQPTRHFVWQPTGTLTDAELRDPLLGPITERLAPGTPVLITTGAVDRLLPSQASGTTVVLLNATGTAQPTAEATATTPATTPAATASALRAAGARVLGPGAQVRVRSDELAALRDDGLTRGVGTVYAVGTAVAVLFGLLAVALELVLSSAERSRTTSYLRTLGLSSRAAGTLHLVQLVPLALAAAVGGVLLGLLEPRLMGGSLNLRQFTGGPVQPALRTDYRLTLALGAGLALLVLGAAVVETAVARRRRLGAVLRLGQS